MSLDALTAVTYINRILTVAVLNIPSTNYPNVFQLMKKMSSTDTPLSTLNMLQAKQKETQSPYVVLSGGKQANTNTTIAKARR